MSTRSSQTTPQSSAAEMSRDNSRSINRDPGGPNVIASTISFTAPDTISDSGNGLGKMTPGQSIEVRGSVANDRQYTISTAAAGALTVYPAMVTTGAAGPLITVCRVD